MVGSSSKGSPTPSLKKNISMLLKKKIFFILQGLFLDSQDKQRLVECQVCD